MSTEAFHFINVLETSKPSCEELVELLTGGMDGVIKHRPGFLGARIYAALDGSRVINVADWRTVEDIRATKDHPPAAELARRTAALATVHPGVFRRVGRW